MTARHDLVVVGAGSGGLIAAGFAARLGARVALVEKHRIGGDCTWTGCVPSKALLRLARLAEEVRRASALGLAAPPLAVDLARVRAQVREAIEAVYQLEAPPELERRGIEVVVGGARFIDAHTIAVGERTLVARRVLLCTGARPAVPPIEGLADVPHFTYETIFDNERLPQHLLVLGAGPVGIELAQAYRRLGAGVTVVAPEILDKEEPEARVVVERVLASEGVRFVRARATAVRREGVDIVLAHEEGEARGDALLVAAGRRPRVDGLGLELAGVAYDRRGIRVDDRLRTSARHIYAAGDVIGGPQFTHLAGWQAFQAVRNALLPGSASGRPDVLPRVTFVDPEVAQVGATEAEARAAHGDGIAVRRIHLAHIDRAICDREREGFVKTIACGRGRLIGATIVAPRAGEMIAELALAIRHGLDFAAVASTIHAYPTWSMPIQELASDAVLDRFLDSAVGRVALRAARLRR